MKILGYAAAVATLGLSSVASAQSLEETYANLCSDEASKQTEACAALRKAMLEKLTAEAGQQLPGSALSPQRSESLAGQISPEEASSASIPDSLAVDFDASSLNPRWGTLARLVDTQWAGEDVGDKSDPQMPRIYRNYVSFSYLNGGEALEIQETIELTKAVPGRIIVLRLTSEPGIYSGEIRQSKTGGHWKTTFRTQPNGDVVSDWYKVIDAGHGLREMHARIGYKLMPDGTLAHIGSHGWDKDRPALANPNDPKQSKFRLRYYSEADLQRLIEEQLATWTDYIELERQTAEMQRQTEAFQAQMQRERAARKASSGGILGALVGAAVGVYAGTAAGLDTGQVVGAIMKGASVTGSGPLANALGSTGDQLLTGGSASSALTGGFGNASTAGASYPTKPNLAASACSGFTEGNYRSRALEGGGDSQLNTMCGQAFEYYTMYKRAIAQGYSEADANRTYAAHEQSAQVASGYLSSHGAN